MNSVSWPLTVTPTTVTRRRGRVRLIPHWIPTGSDVKGKCVEASGTAASCRQRATRRERRAASSLHPIIRRFLRDDDVVDVAFAKARRADADEAGLSLESGDV